MKCLVTCEGRGIGFTSASYPCGIDGLGVTALQALRILDAGYPGLRSLGLAAPRASTSRAYSPQIWLVWENPRV
jgi:hypothetical protein